MSRLLPVWMGFVLLALVSPMTAWADPKDDARKHFIAGLTAAQAGEFEIALQHFLAAQEAYPHPATLYNIARSYQDLGDLTNALTYYRLFHDADPTHAADVEPVIAVIEARLKQENGTAAPAPTGTPTSGMAVSNEILLRLQSLATEMQAKLDEVHALTEAMAQGQPSSEPAPADPEGAPTPAEAAVIPQIAEGGFLTDAYQRVVVTASRYGQEPLDSPSAVTVLTDEDLRLSGATSLPEVLRRVVGVDAMALAAGHTDISIRGFNRELSNKVLVLIDGRSTYLDFIGTTLWGSLPISLDEIERIEIIRGPGSAVYGANAVTGVVNIITRVPGEGKNLVHVDVGTTGYQQTSALLTGHEGTVGYRFSAGYGRAGRWAKEIDPDDSARTFALEDQDLGYEAIRANGRIDRPFGKGFASLSGGYSDSLEEYYNIGILGDYYIDLRHHYLRGDVSYGPVHLRAFWNGDSGVTAPWSEPTDWVRSLDAKLDSDVVDVEVEASHELTTGVIAHRLNAGVGYRYKHTAFDYIPRPVNENHEDAFVQDEATISKLKLVGSLRADRHPLLPLSQTFSPRGAAIYRIRDKSSVRVTGGTAFRAPNHVENYMAFVAPTSVDGVFILDYGDTELRPERILTAEFGFHDESTAFHVADVSVYVNRLTDIIFLEDVEPAVKPPHAVVTYDDELMGYLAGTTGWSNTSDIFLGYGVEAETEIFPFDGLDVHGNVAFARIQQTVDGVTSRDKSTSEWKVNAGVSYRTPYRTDFTFDANYASPQVWGLRNFDSTGQLVVSMLPVDARLILSGRVGVRPLPNEALELGVGCWNIGTALDAESGLFSRFREHPKGQPIGPKAFASVLYRF